MSPADASVFARPPTRRPSRPESRRTQRARPALRSRAVTRRPPEFDLDHDALRADAGLPRLDEDALARLEARLRAAFRGGEGAVIAPREVEPLLAALETLRAVGDAHAAGFSVDGDGLDDEDDDD